MWTVICVYCGKEIKESEPCYPVYDKGNHKEYRHTTCYPKEKTFGEVTEVDGEELD